MDPLQRCRLITYTSKGFAPLSYHSLIETHVRAIIMLNLMVWHVENKVVMALFVMLLIVKLGHTLMQGG